MEDTGGREVDTAEAGRGFALAYGYLNRRERTVAEVRARLAKAGIGDDEIDSVIAELVELSYLDDARYARVFTEDRRTLDAWGKERISRALRERGVDRELIVVALAEAAPTAQDGELGRAVALLAQRFPSGPVDPRDRERAYGVLVRKGYGSDVAADAVRRWAGGELTGS
jgi:regulatory protein